MASMVDLVSLCRLHMRPLQLHLQQFPGYNDLLMTTPISKSEEATQHLQWWNTPRLWNQGVPFTCNLPMTSVTTDASLSGWGAHWGNRTAWGTWSVQEQYLHINVLEMLAVQRALEAFHTQVRNTRVTIFSDNTTVVAYINRQGGTRSDKLCRLAWEVLTTASDSGMVLRASHIAGKDNVMADALSRGHLDPNEWTLSQQTCDRIFLRFGRPLIDLFARGTTTGCPPFAPGDSTHRPFT
ncbi:putative TBC1 domain family member 2A [Apostichopus japonicus]|uniref:Putative TBC1 domain family member 2A n=1 Tax=Stichopus japonicus TaxID=307972 RepID=A0A2G8K4D4_STIJA|nr:putative TBC1 domain family member 2A [Apostichopus japonicus]